MKSDHLSHPSSDEVGIGRQRPSGVPTATYAKRKLVKPQTVRKRYSQTGSYFGTVPRKLESGRLEWPAEGDEQ